MLVGQAGEQTTKEMTKCDTPVKIPHVHAHLFRWRDTPGVFFWTGARPHLTEGEHQDRRDDNPTSHTEQVESKAGDGDANADNYAGQWRSLAH